MQSDGAIEILSCLIMMENLQRSGEIKLLWNKWKDKQDGDYQSAWSMAPNDESDPRSIIWFGLSQENLGNDGLEYQTHGENLMKLLLVAQEHFIFN